MGIPRCARQLLALALLAPVLGLGGSTLVASATARPAASKSPISLGSLSNSLQGEERLTFKAVYVDHPKTGASSSITFEQKAPNSLVLVGGGELLTEGGKTYYCAKPGSTTTCYVATTTDPLAAVFDIFDPAVVITELKAIQQEVTAKLAGVTVTSATKTIAGSSAQCEIVKTKSGTGEWCITSGGFLGYIGEGSGGYLELQSFSTSVSSSDFKLPAGATVQTIP